MSATNFSKCTRESKWLSSRHANQNLLAATFFDTNHVQDLPGLSVPDASVLRTRPYGGRCPT